MKRAPPSFRRRPPRLFPPFLLILMEAGREQTELVSICHQMRAPRPRGPPASTLPTALHPPALPARAALLTHQPGPGAARTHPRHAPAPAARIRPHPSPTPPACPTDRPRTPPPARGLQTPMTLRHRSPSLPVSREAKKHQVVRLSQSLTHVHVAVILIMDMLETAHLYCK
jgi:hypothetical protein